MILLSLPRPCTPDPESKAKSCSLTQQSTMSSVKLTLLVVSCLVLGSEGRKIQFKDCGNGEIKSVDVNPCEKEPCMFKKNSIVHVEADAVATKAVASGTLKVTVLLGDVEVEYPGIEPDICKLVACPIKQGDSYTIKLDIEVADYFPAVETTMKWLAEGNAGEGTILCVTVQVGIME